MTYKTEDVLIFYGDKKFNQDTVKRHYIKWRKAQEPLIPFRCDIPACTYHTKTLSWNGRPLDLILDHINGVNIDNTPQNLRLLCPNCNSQQPTHGGGNKGRVIKISEIAYMYKNNEGGEAVKIIPNTLE